jgi:Protein of unknown function (DUF4230)
MKRTVITFALGATIAAGALTYYNGTTTVSPSAPKLSPVEAKHYVDRTAVLNAISETPQLVGLTGNVAKTITYSDDKWFGDKTYELTLNGEFKLGVETKDIDITTRGNTVVVRFPQPKILAVDLPFDQAEIRKNVGLLRGELDESELQALYAEARNSAVHDIKVNIRAREKAEAAVQHTLEDLIEQVPYVENVVFAN